MSETWYDCDWQEFPRCPKCGEYDQDWWDGLNIQVEDGSEWQTCCADCGTDFHVAACVDISFSTSLEGPDAAHAAESEE